MKTIILISFIVGFSAISAFSQDKLSLNLDTSGIDVSTYTDLRTYYQESQEHQMTAPTLTELSQLMEKTQAKRLANTPNSLDILESNRSYDNMPCLKPMLTDAMPVVKPDTTVLYTLRIKTLN